MEQRFGKSNRTSVKLQHLYLSIKRQEVGNLLNAKEPEKVLITIAILTIHGAVKLKQNLFLIMFLQFLSC